MSHAIHNDIGHEFEGEGGILSRILGIIGPFESVAKILIPWNAYFATPSRTTEPSTGAKDAIG